MYSHPQLTHPNPKSVEAQCQKRKKKKKKECQETQIKSQICRSNMPTYIDPLF